MKEYEFICPKCGGNTIEEVTEPMKRYTRVVIQDYSSGPEMYEDDTPEYYDVGATTSWRCASCEWELPCDSPEEVVDFVVDQEIDRRT